jgi:hypothetical protein
MSEQAKSGIEQFLHRALRATLTRAPGDVCTLTPAAGSGLPALPGETLLVVTISSFVFRLLTLFQLAANPATRAYYAGGAGQSLDEAFREVANMCCGALSRELSGHFPHLAMSVPYALSAQCSAFLRELQPQYLASTAITINDTVQLQATLCMCCSAPVDFAASEAVIEHNGGELEMF